MNEDQEIEEALLSTYIEQVYPFMEYGYWAVVRQEDNQLIGKAGLTPRSLDGKQYTELGYLIHRDYRGQGYGLEACREIIRLSKSYFDIKQLHCFIHRKNHGSFEFAKKLGFEMSGRVEIGNQEHIQMIYRME